MNPYPSLHLAVPLPDGGEVSLRPLRHGESAPLLAVFDGMSTASRADRYLTGTSRLLPSMVRALTDVDGHDHVAWLASVDDRPVGIARSVRVAPCTGELAFEVVDAQQGRGIGSVLADAVTTTALARGVRRVRATVLPGNTASLRLLRRLGVCLAWDEGVLEGEGALRLLPVPRVDRRAVLALAARSARTGPDRAWTSAASSAD